MRLKVVAALAAGLVLTAVAPTVGNAIHPQIEGTKCATVKQKRTVRGTPYVCTKTKNGSFWFANSSAKNPGGSTGGSNASGASSGGASGSGSTTTSTAVTTTTTAAVNVSGLSRYAADSVRAMPKPLTHQCTPESVDGTQGRWYRTDRTLVVDPRNPDRMLVAVEWLGIYESLDAGVTWRPLSATGMVHDMVKADGNVCMKEIFEIVFDPIVAGRIYIFYGGTGTVVSNKWQARGSGYYVSNDDGATWSLLNAPTMNSYTNSLAVDPFDRNTIYAGTAAIPLTSTGADPNEVFVSKGIVYKIEGVDKGGTTWTELPTGFGRMTRANTLWADPAVRGRLVMGVFVQQNVGNRGQSGTNMQAGWYESRDAGETWTSMGSGTGHGVPVVDAAISTDGTHIINTTQWDEDATYVSADGGRTWTRLADRVVVAMFDGRGDGRRAFAVLDTPLRDGPNTLVRSDDGGLSWTPIGKLPPEFATNAYNEEPIKRRAMPSKIVVHPDRPEIMYVSGAGGLIARSTDSGATWTMLMTWERFPAYNVVAR